jgi:hypothetical protein
MTFLRHNRRHANERVLIIEAGQVVCPRRGLVDIEHCWMCPAYRGPARGVADGIACATEPISLDPRFVAGSHSTTGGTIQTLVMQAVLVAIFVAGYVAVGREWRAIASPEARPLGTREHRRGVAS